LKDNKPIFSGTAEPKAVIEIREGSEVLCSTTADDEGNWTCAPQLPLTEGDHQLRVVQTDQADNVSEAYELGVKIDTKAPIPPSVDKPVTGLIKDKKPVFSGTGEAGTTLTIYDKGKPVPGCQNVKVDENGAWSCTPSIDLSEGEHNLKLTLTDSVGNVSAETEHRLVLDSKPPTAPRVSSPKPNQPNQGPEFSGTGENGATVRVTDQNGRLICEASVVGGKWSCSPDSPWPDGNYQIDVTQIDPAGNESSKVHLGFEVDNTPPTAPVVNSPKPGSVVTGPEFSGTGEPGATIEVAGANGDQLCQAVVRDDGSWSCRATLPDGSNSVVVTQRDPAGNRSGQTSVTFEVDNTAPVKPVITAPGADTAEPQPNFEGTGEPGARVTITDNGVPVPGCTDILVGADGVWRCFPKEPLTDGEHDFVPVITDPAGNSTIGDSYPVRVATPKPPHPPQVDRSNGALVTGLAHPGSTVRVTDADGLELPGCVGIQASDDGTFSCRPGRTLASGEVLSVTATDADGRVSAPTKIEIELIAIRLAKVDVHRGTVQHVTGLNFIPGELVTGTIHSEPIHLGAVRADADGQVVFSEIKLPAEFETGAHWVILTGETSGTVSANFSVLHDIMVDTGVPEDVSGGHAYGPTGAGMVLLGLIGVSWLIAMKRRLDRDPFSRKVWSC
jgi:hypothetical protein